MICLLAAGCGSNEPNFGPDVQHNRPVQVSPTHPLAHVADDPAIDRSNVVITPHKQQQVVAPEQPPPTKPEPLESLSKLPQWHTVDETKVQIAGIRKLESKRLVLYTDLPSSPEIDDFPQVFDQAFDLWCKYFGLNPDDLPEWRLRASLIDDPARFKACGLLPADIPKFLNGFTRQNECWLYNQTSPYYRRHLLLHEGVHGFMFTLIGRNAPPWYMEGMAELLGTHRWQDGKLELPYFPKQADEVPKLGRIEIVQKDFANGQAKQFLTVMDYAGQDYLKVEAYGWSWTAAAFLDGYPRYRDRFRKLPALLSTPGDFNAKFREAFAADFDQLQEEWQVFVADIAYGYDFERTAVDFSPGKPLADGAAHATVQADRGWQNTGIQLEAGKTYKLTATGSYQVAAEPKPWVSEPGGVSIHYVHGKPLGILLAAVHPNNSENLGISALLKPIVVGTGTSITPAESGTLFLKINDSAGELSDNSGHADVEIKAE